ncbi:Hypothetical Protein CGB_D4390W [Cryptococcus gattii WM276]|uniref:BHLH domain-containing protein n=1 Tax=Cryptococcus gattii serotype B (strain WM276 / ATCC MYA-4071) TaxID=367775 RepID=E6R3W7_CRYGW|nr:Hypothetical Protein CGB_D4390W [Cryptococcus gattii WM276]ADV21767.1 Hypothetical Protein CGB_D4390W [Cryptococcus gattii WM276]
MPDIDFSLKIHDNAFGNDEIPDSSFSFLNTDTSMDFYLASPIERTKSPEINGNQPNENAKESSHDRFSPPLTMNDHVMQPLDLSNTIYSYPSYALTYQHQQSLCNTDIENGSHHHPDIFQPYRPNTDSDFTKRPLGSPESPSLSSSPHGSIESSRLSFGALTAVSPSLVSPRSISDSIPDSSPTQSYGVYHGPVYSRTQSMGMQDMGMGTGNIFTTGPGLSMVAGFPYPTSMVSQQGLKAGPMRNIRRRTREKKLKEEDVTDDDDDDDDSSKGLGLTNENEDQVPVSNKREDVRRARIESEQRRRDELREGFKRLKDALPTTNQRSSKSSLLNRSHIEAMEGANRYLLAQLKEQQKECSKLREILHGEVMQKNASDSPDQRDHRHPL